MINDTIAAATSRGDSDDDDDRYRESIDLEMRPLTAPYRNSTDRFLKAALKKANASLKASRERHGYAYTAQTAGMVRWWTNYRSVVLDLVKQNERRRYDG